MPNHAHRKQSHFHFLRFVVFMSAIGVSSPSAASFVLDAVNGRGPAASLIRSEHGWFDESLPIPVMHIEGGIEEVARTHGEFLTKSASAKNYNSRETVTYFGRMLEHKIRANKNISSIPMGPNVIQWLFEKFVRAPMIEHVPDRYQKAYSDFAKAAGVEENLVLNALTLPDSALRTVSIAYKLEGAPILNSNFGCTSIIWNSGPASVLHGRNLDYEGVGFWDQNPLILHVIPNEGLAYVAITALGMHAPGITAFNETGLTLSVHQLTLSDTQSSGTPVPVISAEIIRNARTIDDAIAILRSFPRAGSWAYVLSQGHDRAVIETSASDIAIRRSSEPFFYQTNHVSSPALASRQIFYTPGSWVDSFERAETLSRFSKKPEARGWATPEKMSALLGSHQRVAGGTIAKLDNVQSVIFDASHRRIWISQIGRDAKIDAAGPRPLTASYSNEPDLAPNENSYLEYHWSDLRSADIPEVTGAEVTLLTSDEMGEPRSDLRKLLRLAINQKLYPEERLKLLHEYSKKVEEMTSGNSFPSGIWSGLYLAVWENLRQGSNKSKDLDQLLKWIDLALRDPDLKLSNASLVSEKARRHRHSLGKLYRARLFDLIGRRSDALFEYTLVQKLAPFERVKKAAEQGTRRSFTWAQAEQTSIDWPGIDLYRY